MAVEEKKEPAGVSLMSEQEIEREIAFLRKKLDERRAFEEAFELDHSVERALFMNRLSPLIRELEARRRRRAEAAKAFTSKRGLAEVWEDESVGWKGYATECVFASCLESGHEVGPIWGTHERSIKRALFTLSRECPCGVKFHTQVDEVELEIQEAASQDDEGDLTEEDYDRWLGKIMSRAAAKEEEERKVWSRITAERREAMRTKERLIAEQVAQSYEQWEKWKALEAQGKPVCREHRKWRRMVQDLKGPPRNPAPHCEKCVKIDDPVADMLEDLEQERIKRAAEHEERMKRIRSWARNNTANTNPYEHPGASPDTDPHGVLGVPFFASKDEIKKAYLEAAKRHHPDKNPDDPGAHERFVRIQTAYERLKESA